MINNGELSTPELNTMVFNDKHFKCNCNSKTFKEYHLKNINRHILSQKHISFFNK
jgi:hypothetical protein